MSTFFPRFPEGDFAPLFRLLDDYDTHRSSGSTGSRTQSIRTFQPKFDVKETKDNYILHGELPGIAQKDVDIQFTDAQTLVIKGRIEREYHAGTPPTGAIEGSGEQKKIEEGQSGDNNHQYHKVTVEDENEEGKGKESQATNGSSKQVVQHQKKEQPQHKYWVTERSVGEFQRVFTFPGRVDQDNVKASLKDGILCVTVPKAFAKESRKINIE